MRLATRSQDELEQVSAAKWTSVPPSVVLQGDVEESAASAKFVPKIVAMLRAGRLIVQGGLSKAGIAALVTFVIVGRAKEEGFRLNMMLTVPPS
jgi:hypothetical protein